MELNKIHTGNIADSVLLPGDLKRAEYIAKNYLRDCSEFFMDYGIHGYTGSYHGRMVSVAGSGMGIPSVSLAAGLLYKNYGVHSIIRIGTCGTMQKGVAVGDILIALGCSTTSGINRHVFDGSIFCPVADFSLLRTAVQKAAANGIKVKVGNLLSTDLFYDLAVSEHDRLWWDFGVLGVEMEGAGLYTSALRYGRRALMICTVSDSLTNKQGGMTPAQRETSLHEMITLGLDTVSGSSGVG